MGRKPLQSKGAYHVKILCCVFFIWLFSCFNVNCDGGGMKIRVYVHLYAGSTDSKEFNVANDATLEEIEELVAKTKEELFESWYEVQ